MAHSYYLAREMYASNNGGNKKEVRVVFMASEPRVAYVKFSSTKAYAAIFDANQNHIKNVDYVGGEESNDILVALEEAAGAQIPYGTPGWKNAKEQIRRFKQEYERELLYHSS